MALSSIAQNTGFSGVQSPDCVSLDRKILTLVRSAQYRKNKYDFFHLKKHKWDYRLYKMCAIITVDIINGLEADDGSRFIRIDTPTLGVSYVLGLVRKPSKKWKKS